MNSLACLALIVFMESRGESLQTQKYVASVAIERARQEEVTLCQSMKKPRAYSWMWDNKHTRVNKAELEKLKVVAAHELRKPSLEGRLFFHERRVGRLYRTPYKVITSGNLIFY